MRKLIEILINYGRMQREISDLLLISFKPEMRVMQFSCHELSLIATNIRKMHNKIKELENGKNDHKHYHESEGQGSAT